MARYSAGWVKSPRSVYAMDSALRCDGIARDLLATLRHWATWNHEDEGRIGTVITSWNELAEWTGWSPSQARRAANRLKSVHKIDMTPNMATGRATNMARQGAGLVITVLDYEQNDPAEKDDGEASDRTPGRTPDRTPDRTSGRTPAGPRHRKKKAENQETGGKKGENGKNLSSPPPESGRLKVVPPAYSTADKAVAQEWLAFALEQMPWGAKNATWTEEHFAEAIGKVRQTLGMLDTGMAEVLGFIRTDEFWRKVAVSPASLMTKGKSGLRKIDQILLRIRESEQPKGKLAKMDAAMSAWAKE